MVGGGVGERGEEGKEMRRTRKGSPQERRCLEMASQGRRRFIENRMG